MPYNCNYLYPFSVHSDLSGVMQSCSVRWAHISLYSFCHVQHHILVQAKFKECSVKIADFSKPCNYWSAFAIFVV